MNPRSRGRFWYDFSVYDSRGRLAAVVEAKREFGTDPSWAREWHESVAEHMEPPADANVVLFMPDRVYVWRPGADKSANPDWTFDAGPWLAPYFSRLKIPVRGVDRDVFEKIVELWLQDVVQGNLPDGSNVRGAEDLLDTLRGGEVVQLASSWIKIPRILKS
jgi:hypothetical protein